MRDMTHTLERQGAGVGREGERTGSLPLVLVLVLVLVLAILLVLVALVVRPGRESYNADGAMGRARNGVTKVSCKSWGSNSSRSRSAW